MRLIDVDKAYVDDISCYYGSSCYLEDVENWLSEQPVIDAVPVVRCKDCKHLTPVEGGMPLCTLHNISRVYSDFCSDGDCERECICALD